MDTVLRKACHEISRNIAVQQAQQYCRILAILILIVLMALTAAGTATSAGIAGRGTSNLLQETHGPCDPRLDQPGYVGGADVAGNPVAPADLTAARQPVPDEILVPLGNRRHAGRSDEGPVAGLDGKALDPILNPRPACAPKTR
jgi:hypothetical protein